MGNEQPNSEWSQDQRSDNNSTETSSTSKEAVSDDSTATESARQVEVVDGQSIQPTEDVEALSTFSEQEGPFSFKVLPVIRDTVTDWRVVVYMKGVQGPVYESTENISDGAAEQLGISKRLQNRINDALEYADSYLQIPSELGDHSRQKRSLHELEVMKENE